MDFRLVGGELQGLLQPGLRLLRLVLGQGHIGHTEQGGKVARVETHAFPEGRLGRFQIPLRQRRYPLVELDSRRGSLR